MSTDVGRGILAPRSGANIRDGAAEMRTLGATAASAINTVDLRVSGELAQKIGKAEAYEHLVPRDEAVRYGIPGPRGKVGPVGPKSDVPGPGGSIALEETDPGCFVDSEITWMQWPESGGLPAVWNPNTQSYENPIRVDTSVGTRVLVGDTMIYGDTGWRNVTSLIPNVSSGSAYLRRLTQYVTLLLDDVTISDLTDSWAQLDGFLPPGWRPELGGQMYVPTASRNTSYSNGPVRVRNNGQLVIYDARQKTISLVATWPVAQSWPTSLPGSQP